MRLAELKTEIVRGLKFRQGGLFGGWVQKLVADLSQQYWKGWFGSEVVVRRYHRESLEQGFRLGLNEERNKWPLNQLFAPKVAPIPTVGSEGGP